MLTFLSHLIPFLFGKPSIGWFDIPLEMREMIMENMDIRTRCRFAQCSKLCEKEAKSSKEYLHGIKINRESHPELNISHQEAIENYCLEFVDIGKLSENRSIVIYKTNRRSRTTTEVTTSLKWTKLVSGRAEDIRMEYLNDFLEKCKRSIRRIQVHDEQFPVDTYSMQHLRNLKFIKCPIPVDVLESGLVNLRQIRRADCINLPGTRLSFDQVLQFNGSRLGIISNDFNEANIKEYLKMLKNGEVHRNMKILRIINNQRHNVSGRRVIEDFDVFAFTEWFYLRPMEDPITSNKFIFRFDFNYQRDDDCYCVVEYRTNSFTVQIKTYTVE